MGSNRTTDYGSVDGYEDWVNGMSEYAKWFQEATQFEPHAWQEELGCTSEIDSRLIRIPTGFGKTQGVVGAWAFHRLIHENKNWPRRLVFCLPMRVLVEQTVEVIREILSRMGVAVPVHVLMGGSDATDVGKDDSVEWHLNPESPAVLVGTQDMLLSRALNRGYAVARARWPMEYALLNSDCLWVMDEIQLMDVGLITSVQCQSFRDRFTGNIARKAYTWWMSATLQPEWLKTVDFATSLKELENKTLTIDSQQRKGGLFDILKPLATTNVPAAEDKDSKNFAQVVVEAHLQSESSDHGRITLAVVNTVRSAVEIHAVLLKDKSLKEQHVDLRLVHSRFRGHERASWRDDFLKRESCSKGTNRIIVATQVIEAGVDISSTALVTELAPWPSLVQRFGRAARYGGTARVLVVDRELTAKKCLPYEESALNAAMEAVGRLDDAGASSLESFEDGLREDEPAFLARLYPYDPLHILRHEELSDLFDTDSDLTGADVDISRFIRSGDERDVSVWWWPVGKDGPESRLQPSREALCSVPVGDARNWLCEKGGRLKNKTRAWSWSYLDGKWNRLDGRALLPGHVVLVDSSLGGYSSTTGFTGRPLKKTESISTEGLSQKPSQVTQADLAQDHEDLSSNPYKTIATHGAEAGAVALEVAGALGLDERHSYLLALAARWHDLGKAHVVFQNAMRKEQRVEELQERQDLAKAPNEVWRRGKGIFGKRRGFRHELASTIALFEGLRKVAPLHDALLGTFGELIDVGVLEPVQLETGATCNLLNELAALSAGEFNLVAYLVCAHHGKVRCSWQSTPHDQEYVTKHGADNVAPIRGVHPGDLLPAVSLFDRNGTIDLLPSFELSLDAASLGLSSRYGQSWQERVLELRERLGDIELAFLETLLRVADIRASKLTTSDSLLSSEEL